jgi:hypothetical protein
MPKELYARSVIVLDKTMSLDFLVEQMGLEPTTSALRIRQSAISAISSILKRRYRTIKGSPLLVRVKEIASSWKLRCPLSELQDCP